MNDELTLNKYQVLAGTYMLPNAPPEERVFGILEEAGEVAGVFKRMMRGDYGPDEAAAKLAKELGDILWYIAGVAADNDWTLESIAQTNLEKLESRKQRNVIIGSGNDR